MKKIKNFFKKDWKNIHQDFTPELEREWKDRGFNYEQCKEWIEIGLKASDVGYAQWLRDTKKIDSGWVLDHGNNEELREEYTNYLKNNDSVWQRELNNNRGSSNDLISTLIEVMERRNLSSPLTEELKKSLKVPAQIWLESQEELILKKNDL